MDVNSAMRELASAIVNTPEFVELKKSKAVIDKDSSLSGALKDFHKKQESLYNSRLSESQSQMLTEQLNNDYQRLSANNDIKSYFTASDNFSNLMNNIMKNINSAIENYM